MTHRNQLAGLGNDELLEALATLVKRDNGLTAELLAHLGELDERRLFLGLGFPSLFAYCTEVLGFCESTAGRRIAAARVCRAFPESLAGVANGDWSLSVLCALKPHLNERTAAELFDASRHKSIRHVEEMLAARFPRPDVRDSIRRLPVRRAAADITPGAGCVAEVADVTAGAEATAGAALIEKPVALAWPALLAPSVASPAELGSRETGQNVGRKSSAPGRVEPLSTDRFGVHFTADSAFRELLDEVRALAGYRQPGDLVSLMRAGLQAYRRELEKECFAVGRKQRAARALTSTAKSRAKRGNTEASCSRAVKLRCRRHVPALVAREVYLRDGKRCTFVSDDGRRCGTCRFLEFDHIEPHALGGAETLQNLRLRCWAHNQQHARDHFGPACVRAAIARSRSTRTRCSDRDGVADGELETQVLRGP